MPQHRWPGEQFEFALTQIRLSQTNRRVLQAFLDVPGHTLTAHALAEQAALPGGWTAANLRIGELARKFRPHLGALQPEQDGEPHWWRYVTTGIWRDGRFHWTLRPELRSALVRLGWEVNLITLTPEEVAPGMESSLMEGAVQRVSVNAYERNAEARRVCLEAHGYACFSCGTVLEDIYGVAAADLIHVHHRVPLATIGQNYHVNGQTDLVPVCPNCHAVMHRRNPPYTVAEVQEMLNRTEQAAHPGKAGEG